MAEYEDVLQCGKCDGRLWEIVVSDISETTFNVQKLRCEECKNEIDASPAFIQ